MDNRLQETVMFIPTISARGLLSSKPYQPNYPLLTSSKANSVERESFAVSNNHVGLGSKLIDIVKRKLTYGSKISPLGRGGKIFQKSFGTRDCEKLLHVTRCSIYTTSGPISGKLFISTERVAFRSDRSIKTYSTTGRLLKFQYKVSIPVEKINGIRESMDIKRPSNKYMELVTMDDFSFWFLGFSNYKKTLECVRQTISHSHECLSD